MRKILTFLFAALMSASMFALTPLTGDEWDAVTKTLTVNSNPGDGAYLNQTEIEHVIISSGVESIGYAAFGMCTGLTSVTIGNSVISIGEYAFYGCSGLTSMTIGNSVESIGEYAFYVCSALTSVTIGNSVTSIGKDAFYECSALTSVTIGNSVESIGDEAFYGCSGLTSMTIGNSVTSIGWGAFYNCSGLTSVTIPNSVTSIGKYAFRSCSGLTSVTNYAVTPQNIESKDVFEGVTLSGCTLYVPAESVSAYSTASVWQDFGTKSAIPDPTPQGEEITPNVDPQNASVYYSTFYDSAKKYELPAGVEAYVADLSGANLLLTKIAEAGEVIPADNAVILKSTVTPFTLTPSDADAVTFTATNDLQGVNAAITNPNYGRVYVLSAEDGAVGFYKLSSGATIPAHKAYVTIPSGGAGAPKRLRFVFNAPTGVDQITNNQSPMTNKVLRDGQLIIIRNGVEYNANGQIVK